MTEGRSPDRLLLDEMFSSRIAEMLAARGVDCRAACIDPVLIAADDVVVLEAAVGEGRVLVTNNVADFELLRRARLAEEAPVPGLIYTSDVAFPRNRRFVVRLVDALAHAAEDGLVRTSGGVLWLQPMPST